MTHVTCRLTAKNRDQLRNPTLGNRVRATFTFFTLPDKNWQYHTDSYTVIANILVLGLVSSVPYLLTPPLSSDVDSV